MRGARDRGDRLRHRRSPRADRPADPAGARRRRPRPDGLSRRGWTARAARGDRRVGAATLRVRRSTRTRRSSPRSAARRRSSASRSGGRRRRRRQGHGRVHGARDTPCTSGARCSPTRVRWRCRCSRRTASCPISTRSTSGRGNRLAVFWVNYPNNPTGATAPLSFYERLAELAREHGFVLASDEAYTELWFERAAGVCAAARRPDQRRRLQHALEALVDDRLSQRLRRRRSRRSIAALRAFRPSVGTAPQEFVQRASVVAWGDEAHVERARELYGRKRHALARFLRAEGRARRRQRGDDVPVAGGAAQRGRRELGGVRRAAARARRARHARLVPRRRRGRVLPASRSCPRRRSARRAIAILEDAL